MVQLELPLMNTRPNEAGSVVLEKSPDILLGEIYEIICDTDRHSPDLVACAMSRIEDLIECFFMKQIYQELDL